MSVKEPTFSTKERWLIVFLVLVAMAVTVVAVVPALRNQAKDFFLAPKREILAKVSGRLSPQGPQVTVLKIRTTEGLSLEIYSLDQGFEGVNMMARMNLIERRDAFFSFQGNATNLALTDVDKDGVLEIIAPTYDDQMMARLNIFKYNPTTKSFERMQNPGGH